MREARKKKKVSEHLRIYEIIIFVLATTIVSLAIQNVFSNQLEYFVVLVPLLMATVLLVYAIAHFYQSKIILDGLNRCYSDITYELLRKEVMINRFPNTDEEATDRCCTTTTTYRLRNDMSENYARFKYALETDGEPPGDISDFRIFVDGSVQTYSNADVSFAIFKRTNLREGESPKQGDFPYYTEMFIPVDIEKDGGGKVLKLIRESSSFNDIFKYEGNKFVGDAITTGVKDRTRVLEFHIVLSESLKNEGYKLILKKTDDGKPFKIYDYSKQKMKQHEESLGNKVPKIESDGSIFWRVSDPVIGYSYKLLFNLKK